MVIRLICLMMALSVVMAAMGSADAATVNWTGGAYGDWDNTANWSTKLLPGSSDTANINITGACTVRHWIGSHSIWALTCDETLNFTGGDISIANSSSIANLTLTGGYFHGVGALSLYGSSLWGYGTLANTGGVTNTSTGILELNGTGYKDLSTTFKNYGIVNHKGSLNIYNNGSLYNYNTGLYDIQTDTDIMVSSGSALITNYGMFRKTITDGQSSIYPAFNNNYQVVANSGTLRFMGGGISGAGTFGADGGTIVFDNDVYTMRGICQAGGSGTVELAAGGTLQLDGSGQLKCNLDRYFRIAGGTVSGMGGLINQKYMEWSGGALIGAGNVSNQYVMNITGSTTKWMLGSVLGNSNTLVHKGKGGIQMSQSSQLYNLSGATYDLQTDAGFTCPDGSSAIHNSGTFQKDWSYGASIVEPYFDNQGLIDVQTGSLNLRGGGMFKDCGVNTRRPATLIVENGAYTVYGEFDTGGSGYAAFNGGTLSLSDGSTAKFSLESGLLLAGTNVSGYGNLINTWAAEWSAGTIGNLTHFINEGALSITGGAEKWLQNAVFHNAKDITHTGLGNLHMDSTSTMSTQGGSTYTFGSDAGITGNGTISHGGAFKKLCSGTSIIEPSITDYNGYFDIQNGTISLKGGGTYYDGGANLVYPGNLTIAAGDYTMNGRFTASGEGAATLSGGTMNMALGAQVKFGLDSGLHIAGITTKGPGCMFNTWNADWASGTMGDQSVFENDGTLSIIGSDTKYMQGAKLYNPGTISHTGTGSIDFKNKSTFTNTGTYTITTDADFICSDGGSTFVNGGTFTKDRSTAITNFQTTFNNDRGLISVQSGLVRLSGGGSFRDGFANVSGPNTLDFSGGNFDLTGIFQASGEGSVSFGGGTLSLNTGAQAKLGISGGFHFYGGTISGQGEIFSTVLGDWSQGTLAEDAVLTNNAAFSIIGSGTKSLKRARLTNMSQMTQTGTGPLDIDANSILTNISNGVYDIQGDYPISGAGRIDNGCLFIKSQGTGASQIEPVMNNTGTVEVDSGAMVFRSPAAQMVDGTLNGGKWIVRDGCTLDMGRDTPIFNNAAEVTLIGRSSFPQFDNLELNSGIIHVSNDHELVTAGALTNSGEMDFGGCVLVSGKNLNTGNWHGAGLIRGGLSNRGTLRPVASLGEFRTMGSFSQTDTGTLQINLAGKSTGQFGAITVGTSASLAGTLQISLVGRYIPQRGDSFRIISSKTRTGKFTTITGQNLANGLTLNPIYTSTGVVLVVGDSLPAQTEVTSVAAAKQQPGASWVSVPGIVSAVVSDAFFIEDANRAAGLRVTTVQTPPAVGQKVQVAGQINQFDMCLTLKTAQWVPFSDALQLIKPLALTGVDLGGAPLGQQGGIYHGLGLNNVGLLVRVTGKVTYLASGSLAYIDDGSGLLDGNTLAAGRPVPGVRIMLSPSANIPAGTTWATVTGISYRQYVNDRPQRAILATKVESAAY